ncbi:MAG: hypothetical protein RLZZ175_1106 [Bacteroidota bacterium]|jgi:hypothetical protein
MRIENLSLGFNKLSYDEFTWSDNERVNSKVKIQIIISIDNEQLKTLSKSIFENYIEIIRDVPDYFDNWEEPFPKDEYDILNEPEKLFFYFSKSSLWSDFLIKEISKIQSWQMTQSEYHILKVNNVKKLNNILHLITIGVKI